MGLGPLYHCLIVFLNRLNAVSSVKQGVIHGPFNSFCLMIICKHGCANWKSIFLPTVMWDMGSPSLDNAVGKVRNDEELLMQMYCSSSRDFSGPIFFVFGYFLITRWSRR